MKREAHVKISEGRWRRLSSVLSCLIWGGVLTISPLFESLSLCALFTEWWVFTLARARLCLPPFYQSLPRSHFIPFFRVPAIVPSFLLYGIKYQAAGHNVPPVFLGSLYLFLSSSPSTFCEIFATYRRYFSHRRRISSLNVSDRFVHIRQIWLKIFDRFAKEIRLFV